MYRELSLRGLKFKRRISVPVEYKRIKLDCGFRPDLVVEDLVAVEIKAVEKVMAVHKAPVLTYLKIMNLKLGLLINFNEQLIKNGTHRIINGILGPGEAE